MSKFNSRYDIVHGNDGIVAGTSEVLVVPAPIENTKHIIKTLTVHNTDTVNAVAHICLKNGTALRHLYTAVMAPSYSYILPTDEEIVLDTPDKSLVVFLSAPTTTYPCDFNCAYEKHSKYDIQN